ncbi:MAG TPA: HlyD family efflux transporter periplasmic adaptor subunit [Candidatus Xenobia bacterium]|jgi:multidrug resistance efflux pump
MKRLLLPLLALLVFGGGGLLVDLHRQRERSVMSGFFESQPTVVASRSGGRVQRILTPEGAKVSAGQRLMELEAAPGQADTAALEAAARQAEAHFQAVHAGPRPEDIRRQEAVVAELRSQLDKTVNGAQPEEIASAQARYDQAQARYAEALHGPTWEDRGQVRQQMAAAQARRDFAKKEMGRQQSLYAQDATSRHAVDQAVSDYDAAEATLRSAEDAFYQARRGTRTEDIAQARADKEAARQQWLLLKGGSRPEDVAAARARLAQAQAQLDELRRGNRPEDVAEARAQAARAQAEARSAVAKTAERQVTAPLAAVVERNLVAVGDLVTIGQPLARLADPTDIWLRVYLPEADLAKVKVGDAAQLQVDGIDPRVPAVVDVIATQGEFTPANVQTPGDRGQQVYAVRLRLANPDARIKAGMEATVKSMGQWR